MDDFLRQRQKLFWEIYDNFKNRKYKRYIQPKYDAWPIPWYAIEPDVTDIII